MFKFNGTRLVANYCYVTHPTIDEVKAGDFLGHLNTQNRRGDTYDVYEVVKVNAKSVTVRGCRLVGIEYRPDSSTHNALFMGDESRDKIIVRLAASRQLQRGGQLMGLLSGAADHGVVSIPLIRELI